MKHIYGSCYDELNRICCGKHIRWSWRISREILSDGIISVCIDKWDV